MAVVVDPRLERVVQATGLAISLLVVGSIWGQWGLVALVIAIDLARIGINVFGVSFARRLCRASPGNRFYPPQTVVVVLNVVVNLLLGHLCNWTQATFLYIPYSVLVTSSYSTWGSTGYMLLSMSSTVSLALIDGASPLSPLCWSALGLSIWAIMSVRTSILDEANAALVSKHQELAQALARLREVQQTVLEQEKLAGLGVLAAGLAHEINNPMAVVSSHVRTLAQDLPTLGGQPDLLREYCEEVIPETLDGIRRVNTVVGSLRRFARADALEMGEYDLNDQVQTALGIVFNQMRDREVVVDLGEAPHLMGHAHQIVQVLVNLLVNAAQASPAGGVIEVATRADRDHVSVRIADHGAGMSDETKKKLFEPFFTTRPVGEGTGLGLCTAYGVVKSHGGGISVISELGTGSTFTVRLPLNVVALQTRGSPARDEASSLAFQERSG